MDAVLSPDHATGRFVARENRFVTRVRLADGEVVHAYLPNTARLTDLLVPEAPVVLRRSRDPRRRTSWTLTRVAQDDTWVALEAGQATDLLADALADGLRLPGLGGAARIQREVPSGPHRLDLALELHDGRRALVEVKSLSRAVDGSAPLSWTPSVRGTRQLAHLASLARSGTPVGVAFVVQRADVEALDLGLPADPAWVAAVREARLAGVTVVAFRCEVDRTCVRLGSAIPVRDDPDPAAVAGPYATTQVHLTAPGRPPVTLLPDPSGRTPGALPDPLPEGASSLHIITACNPRSRRLDAATNRARNQELLEELTARGYTVLRADGRSPDGSWEERGFGLVDAEAAAVLDLARRYDQHAIFELTADRLSVLWTADHHAPIHQGWRVAAPVDRNRPASDARDGPPREDQEAF
ncbi:MAG: DNA/RNA nuclease SfsA [Nitriliruptoraceae bacterium]